MNWAKKFFWDIASLVWPGLKKCFDCGVVEEKRLMTTRPSIGVGIVNICLPCALKRTMKNVKSIYPDIGSGQPTNNETNRAVNREPKGGLDNI